MQTIQLTQQIIRFRTPRRFVIPPVSDHFADLRTWSIYISSIPKSRVASASKIFPTIFIFSVSHHIIQIALFARLHSSNYQREIYIYMAYFGIVWTETAQNWNKSLTRAFPVSAWPFLNFFDCLGMFNILWTKQPTNSHANTSHHL